MSLGLRTPPEPTRGVWSLAGQGRGRRDTRGLAPLSCAVACDIRPFMLQRKLGQHIAELRKARYLTQVQLASAVCCSVKFISLLRGINAPSVSRLEDLARADREMPRTRRRRIPRRTA